MKPASMDEIEIRGEQMGNVRMAFKKPDITPWLQINSWYGVKQV